ncbi:MAG: NADH:ubiquinone reductase (Na(+)-transporting) subunit F [Bacteroidales bacterium]|mgnify:CR=1 FL=1|jgi:Na+-transporting NADH:ubiquinone oxidoreductase subunit F|nr:NADH:ubiquinone reductase (Na(+)-transporting) subunit F [Bacteroidales bacterium]MDD2823901.1 NADH:ubiquinone reductase (Na(+)-transporting) subunit F [Bacteroidales bacterium]MDD3100943.1 NADH:ubiquinone reductase (Na(+)-transporting) subunit F [Bacteroidales bacterium]MDD3639868.1 NADH:ubiquinone reductase (Na(+)-transporting) subunit F [Bacteroidales bacterium]MDD3944573.1 NADH:ubiquinone reductase (Na(+)-transporting) subunit F [Bacteroidales bacterium]
MSIIQFLLLTVSVIMAVTMVLTALLLYAKARLTPSGKVKIRINHEKVLETEPGNTLLSTLAGNQIYLPSACGGGGTCGLCKCRVLSGGGSILSTETGFFTRREQQSQWRLGCQVKVREDMEIEIPEQILGVKKWECEVVSNRNVASFIKEFVIRLPEGEMLDFRSGGYIQIDVPPVTVDFSKDITVDDVYAGDWKSLGLLNLKMVNREYGFRAYSMANHPAEGNRIMLNVRIATPPWDRSRGSFMKVNPGICSSYIFSRKPGDKVMVSGPYGDFFLKDTHAEKIFIGGGAGMAPMRSHIFHLFKTLGTQDKVSFWYGARSAGEIFYEEAFREIEADFPNFTFHLALSEPKPEDHWTGYTGFIHQVLLDQYLKDHPEPEEAEYYLCGPPLMTAAAIRMLDNLGVSEDHILFDDFGG